MACKICGRDACCPSFHSIEAQEEYDRKTEDEEDEEEKET